MAKRGFEQKVADLEELRRAGHTPAAIEGLRTALSDRNNYVVSKAAELATSFEAKELVPELLAAYGRFFVDPIKTDPQCWAKNALSKALAQLGCDDAAVYLRGLKHRQMEPVWGGTSDTAGTLRATCAMALTQCRSLSDTELLKFMVDALFDKEIPVRVAIVQAMATMENASVPLLLRLRVLAGEEPEVLGSCFGAILELDRKDGLAFVTRFLQSSETGAEAALAIGQRRTAESARVLREVYEKEGDAWFRSVLLSALALTRHEEAVEFLISIVERDARDRDATIQALQNAQLGDEVTGRLARAIHYGEPRSKKG
jgi:HEAT repeat protein